MVSDNQGSLENCGCWVVGGAYSRLSGYETCGDFRLSGDWESHDNKQMSFWVLGLMVECIRREIVASEYIFRI